MRLELKRLILGRWKGIDAFHLDLHSATNNVVTIYGDNATGKTTLIDAWCWLLFDADSRGQRDFEIKPLDDNGEPAHGLDHVVSATLRVDGETHDLRRVYRERWSKRRGEAERVFSGHTSDYFINDVPTKKKDYDAFIDGLCTIERFRLLTDPTYFAEQMHWTDRRRVLLDVIGDPSTDDVIAASGVDLVDLPSLLKRRSVDEYRQVVAERRKQVKQELEQIPVRIDETRRGMDALGDAVPAEKLAALQGHLLELRRRQSQLLERRVAINEGSVPPEMRQELEEINDRLATARALHRRAAEDVQEALTQRRRANARALEVAGDSLRDAKIERDRAEQLVRQHNQELRVLRDRWQEIADRDINADSIDGRCPTCGRDLPRERVDDMIAKARQQQAANLADLNAAAKREQAALDDATVALERADLDIDESKRELERLEKEVEKEAVDFLESSQAAAAEPAEIADLIAQRTAVQDTIARAKTNVEDAVAQVDAERHSVDAEIHAVSNLLATEKQRNAMRARLDELKDALRRRAIEYETAERELYLCDEFVRTKARIMHKAIEAKFTTARFELFRPLVGGGVQETCEVVRDGVPYSRGLNHGARVQVGLDIIRALQEHYDFYPPVWIDQCESITELPAMDCQTIRLVVSAQDKSLRVDHTVADATQMKGRKTA